MTSLLPEEQKWKETSTQQMVSSGDQARLHQREEGYLGSLMLPKEIPSKRQAVIYYGCSFFLFFLRAVLMLFGKNYLQNILAVIAHAPGGSLDTVFSDL